jgi:hypothetical protein
VNPEQIIVPGLAEAQAQQAKPPTGATVVSVHDGLVVLHFERACEYAVYAPVGAVSDATRMMAFAAAEDAQAAQLVVNAAMFLIDHVYEVRGDLKPAGGAVKHELIERHRRTLTKRLEVMLNSRREKRTVSNQQLAKEAVEVMLKAVFS